MPTMSLLRLIPLVTLLSTLSAFDDPVRTVIDTPGCVAFWDFVRRESDRRRSIHRARPAWGDE